MTRQEVEQYITEHQDELISILLRNDKIPNELVMDVYQLTVAQMLDHHEEVRSPRNLFNTISRRQYVIFLRRQYGRGEQRHFVHEDELDSYVTPSGIDTMAQLDQALGLLPERQREYVNAVYLEELEDDELTTRFAPNTPKSVKSMARRAIIQLRELV